MSRNVLRNVHTWAINKFLQGFFQFTQRVHHSHLFAAFFFCSFSSSPQTLAGRAYTLSRATFSTCMSGKVFHRVPVDSSLNLRILHFPRFLPRVFSPAVLSIFAILSLSQTLIIELASQFNRRIIIRTNTTRKILLIPFLSHGLLPLLFNYTFVGVRSLSQQIICGGNYIVYFRFF